MIRGYLTSNQSVTLATTKHESVVNIMKDMDQGSGADSEYTGREIVIKRLRAKFSLRPAAAALQRIQRYLKVRVSIISTSRSSADSISVDEVYTVQPEPANPFVWQNPLFESQIEIIGSDEWSLKFPAIEGENVTGTDTVPAHVVDTIAGALQQVYETAGGVNVAMMWGNGVLAAGGFDTYPGPTILVPPSLLRTGNISGAIGGVSGTGTHTSSELVSVFEIDTAQSYAVSGDWFDFDWDFDLDLVCRLIPDSGNPGESIQLSNGLRVVYQGLSDEITDFIIDASFRIDYDIE